MLEDKFLAAEKPSYKGLFQLRRLLYDGTFNTQLSECVGSAFQQEIDLDKSVTLITPKTSLLESFREKENLIAVRYSEKHSGEYYVHVKDFIDRGEFLKLICAFPSDTKYNLGEWKSYSPDEKRKKSEQGDIVAFTFWEKKVIKLHFMNRIVKKVENAEVIPPSAVGATIFEDEKNKKAIGMVTRDSNGDLKPKLFTTEEKRKWTATPQKIKTTGSSLLFEILCVPCSAKLKDINISYLTGNGETTQPTETDEEQPSTSCETDWGKPIQDNMPHTQQAYQARHKQDTSYTAKGSGICLRQQPLKHTVELISLIKINLDTESHFGGDYKSLAGAFRYSSEKINYLKSLQGIQSPTEVLLKAKGHITVGKLMEKLEQIENIAALDEVKTWLKKECECDICKVE
ncbi:uncharacterized protein LOC116611737 isoform X2 [Nematostella vectensis]|uniref:uncharacterized protein LOC116611737 isoform X2 n=1 Tax=Nematostella vectensis TaxID=45351 RepID=UPI0020771016|nr:uncharacterized protein LOC116611737 isoform X2 [Nematostella vectensis]